ncbi:hypothetical protein CC78DRAFT_463443 [Lojkania enalia]|uniref:RRM domain-containing protein n=1 Tax=Lojkania enalia TaxID=147567 RepID=A0A9P4K9H8_9PLEO|nr:hypothetical protein CC78DRAFT_463443 [Didymosphaeria enalia]
MASPGPASQSPTASKRTPFPQDVDDFKNDERISYSFADSKYLLVDEDGEEWEWNSSVNKWFVPATEEEVAAMQANYGGHWDDESHETELSKSQQKKRKAAELAEAASKKAKVQNENRAVFVRGLPLDATLLEIEEEFGRFAGLIDEGVDGKKRVTMYTDDDGNFKGEALIVFFRKESVRQAINLCDDRELRYGCGVKMIVEEAQQSYKKSQNTGDMKFKREEKKAAERNRAEMNRKLAEWSDDEAPVDYLPKNKYANYAILKHCFTLDEIDEDPGLILYIKEDFREEAETCGEVTNVVLYDKEPEGVMMFRFKEDHQAAKFVKKYNGKLYGEKGKKQKLIGYVPIDRFRFRKSGKKGAEDSEEEAERLERFGQSLEAKK